MSYKCPNCGGGLKFDPVSQKFKCEYCLASFTEDDMKRLEAEEAKKREDDGSAAVYTCPSCGAEIVTDETTAATFCYYCHNPVRGRQKEGAGDLPRLDRKEKIRSALVLLGGPDREDDRRIFPLSDVQLYGGGKAHG